ncbi:MAG: aldehyde dehydrogenase [Bacteroidetes bacterium]|nr:MAG: aldehyde dehydrogenase [Bacteroidota bacterium]
MKFEIKNYIAGELIAPIASQYLDNFAPATGELYSLVPDSEAQDVALAVESAQRAFPAWRDLGAEGRSAYMLRLADVLERDIEKFALAESKDSGKPLSLARTMDIPRAIQNIRFFATAILHAHTETHDASPAMLNYTLRQPIGVVGCISPWNLPLYLFTWKIAPALASGNCVIAKPSELTPMTAYLLAELCQEIGLPAGVLNILHGLGGKVGEAIVSHPGIKAISFTGGTATGSVIARHAAPVFKKLSLELGGKNPVLIFADCEYDTMLATTVRSSFTNQGQICLCGSRILVERSLYERFRQDFVQEVQKLTVGNPLHESTRLGAVISAGHQQKILGYIALAQEEGGKILTGGKAVKPEGCENGWFVEPTVIEGLPYDCRTNQEEIFGPVVTIQPFDTEEEALKYANSVRYGLASVLWTQNLSRTQRITQAIESGIVWVNCWLMRDLRTPWPLALRFKTSSKESYPLILSKTFCGK